MAGGPRKSVLVVGSSNHEQSKELIERFNRVCHELGQRIARSGYALRICSTNPRTADPHAVTGYIEAGGQEPTFVRREDETTRKDWPELTAKVPGARIELLPERTDPRVWRLRALRGADGVLLIGGRQGTATTLELCTLRARCFVGIPMFGGSGEHAYSSLQHLVEAAGMSSLASHVAQVRTDPRSAVELLAGMWADRAALFPPIVRRGDAESHVFAALARAAETPRPVDGLAALLGIAGVTAGGKAFTRLRKILEELDLKVGELDSRTPTGGESVTIDPNFMDSLRIAWAAVPERKTLWGRALVTAILFDRSLREHPTFGPRVDELKQRWHEFLRRDEDETRNRGLWDETLDELLARLAETNEISTVGVLTVQGALDVTLNPVTASATAVAGAGGSVATAVATDPPAPATAPLPDSVYLAAERDAPTTNDLLGFQPYVAAITRFLTGPDTQPPLTLSVEGDWGSGKSSFMLQLEDALKAAEVSKKKAEWSRFVRFNPWRHDKNDAMWAAFALDVARDLARQAGPLARLRGHFRLWRARFDFRGGWADLAGAAAKWIVLLSVLVAAAAGALPWLLELLEREDSASVLGTIAGAGGVVGIAGTGAWLVARALSIFGAPWEVDLGKHVDAPDYGPRLAFVERFHEDFGKICDAYARGRRIYVFIDDLDRCEVPKAAELMQAINLMLPSDGDIAVVLGLDRQKVAAGIAAKHAALVRYIAAATQTASHDERREGLLFGFQFLEKFIQIPFRLPLSGPRQVEDLIRALGKPQPIAVESADRSREGGGARAAAEISTRTDPGNGNGKLAPPRAVVGPASSATTASSIPAASAPGRTSVPTPEVAARREAVAVEVTGDSPRVRSVVRMVAPSLENNPRRIKQFVNLFRLRVLIASETGQLDIGAQRGGTTLSMEQLGKFVALELRWPLLVSELDAAPGLVAELERTAVAFASSGGTPVTAASPSHRVLPWIDDPLLVLRTCSWVRERRVEERIGLRNGRSAEDEGTRRGA